MAMAAEAERTPHRGGTMTRVVQGLVVLGFIAGGATGLRTQEAHEKPSAIANTPEWQQIKSLAGQWDGVVEAEDGKKTPTTVEMRLTGGGSAVMHVMDKDTPTEMVTMFHPDGDRLLATHYCAVHNQPRMALVKSGVPNQIAFDFADGTNIRPGDTHMKRLVLTIKDADHHDETWVSLVDGRETPPLTFSYTRRK
jgi:hypothetical protein